MKFLKKKENIHGYCYELDCSQHNGIYKKSFKEWEKKVRYL